MATTPVIDMSILTKAVETQLKADAALIAAGVIIERSKRVNMDPGRAQLRGNAGGWVGIYPGPSLESAPKTIGVAGAWNNAVQVTVIAQSASYNTEGQEVSDYIETMVAHILSAVGTDLTFGVQKARVIGIRRQYMYLLPDERETGSLFMPQINIILKMEVRS